MLSIQNILIFLFIATIIIKYISQRKKITADKKYFKEVLNHNLKICMLAQVNGMNLLLKEGAKTELQKELFSSLSHSCKYNLDMITTLLESYKFENNEQKPEFENFNINNLLHHNEEIRQLLKEKNIKILYNCKNSLIYADKNLIQKLINNFIYIALVYSYKNSETVITINSAGKNLQFSITYYGNSLAKCANSFTDYMAIGCGIKMYYCKKIVDFYGGKIKLSNINNKVRVEFNLPIICTDTKQIVNSNLSFCKLF